MTKSEGADHHNSHDHHGSTGPIKNTFFDRIMSVTSIFDGPATFFREKVLNKTQKNYPYYHRQFNRVPTVDECPYNDAICIYEANEQYLRDKKVDKFIVQILGERVEECYIREGNYDGFEKCRKLDEDHEKALTNYFIKYGDLGANGTCVDAYMKQKHRLIWQRRNPDKDIVGLDKQKDIREKVAKYQGKMINDPIKG